MSLSLALNTARSSLAASGWRAREHGTPLPDPRESPYRPEIAREVLRDKVLG